MGSEALAARLLKDSEEQPMLKDFVARCLDSMRWGGSVVLMVVDASFTSSGLSYFTAVVPRVLRFKEEQVDLGRVRELRELPGLPLEVKLRYWRNRRSWLVADEVAARLSRLEAPDDRARLRAWASASRLEGWRDDLVGSVKGVGLVTYQYLRMMGGVDTAMPDRIVKRYVYSAGKEAGVDVPLDDVEFVKFLERLRDLYGVSPVAVTWLSWLRLSEGDDVLSRYRELLHLL